LSSYQKIILIILGLAYLVSPWDLLPESIASYPGLIDDGLILFIVYHLIRHNKFPEFRFLKKKFNHFNTGTAGKNQKANNRQKKADDPFHHRQKAGKSTFRSAGQTGTEKKTPYDILNIQPGASKKQIQAAYKTAIKKYHPDKVSHLGKEFSDLANQKFLEIQNAYEWLMNNVN